jgi:hypothetical protein
VTNRKLIEPRARTESQGLLDRPSSHAFPMRWCPIRSSASPFAHASAPAFGPMDWRWTRSFAR